MRQHKLWGRLRLGPLSKKYEVKGKRERDLEQERETNIDREPGERKKERTNERTNERKRPYD